MAMETVLSPALVDRVVGAFPGSQQAASVGNRGTSSLANTGAIDCRIGGRGADAIRGDPSRRALGTPRGARKGACLWNWTLYTTHRASRSPSSAADVPHRPAPWRAHEAAAQSAGGLRAPTDVVRPIS